MRRGGGIREQARTGGREKHRIEAQKIKGQEQGGNRKTKRNKNITREECAITNRNGIINQINKRKVNKINIYINK